MTAHPTSVLDLIDAATKEPVLVFGSLPPAGRDLDLLARPAAAASLGAALSREGFVSAGWSWASFRNCSAEIVEVVPASTWSLAPVDLDELFSDAISLPGRTHVVRPASHHALLILARRMVGAGGRLDEKLRSKVDVALGEDPDGWAPARARAPAWGVVRALALLESAHRSHEPPPRRARASAMTELLRAQGVGRPGAYLRGWRRVLAPRRRRGVVVALSGLSGAGTSSQAASLRRTLDRLGVETAGGWTPFPDESSLALGAGLRPSGEGRDNGGPHRWERSRLVTELWATGLAMAAGVSQRRATRRHVRAGRVVVCDRYTLDSAVRLRGSYAANGTMRLQSWLVGKVSPRPARAYFLEVRPSVAARRKGGRSNLGDLEHQARLYGEEAARMGVRRLDGERPEEDLCGEIAQDLWLAIN